MIPSRINNLKTGAFMLALIAALVLCIPALAQSNNPPTPEPLVLTDQKGKYELGRSMDILEDPGGELTIDEVASPEFATLFVRSQVDVPNYGYTGSAYWVRFQVRNEAPEISRWLIEVGFPNMFFVDLYYPASAEGQGFVQKQSGVMRPVSGRELAYYRMVFYVPLEYQKDTLIYMRFQNDASIFLQLTLWSSDQFINHRMVETLVLGTFYGTLLIMLLYNLLLLYSVRDWNYAYFTLFLCSLLIFYAAYDGMLESYLWPSMNVFKKFTVIWSANSVMLFTLLFTDSFLDLRRQLLHLRKTIFFLVSVWLVQSALVYFVTYKIAAILLVLNGIITFGVVLLISLLLWKRGFLLSRYFLFAWVGFILGGLMIYFSHLGAIRSSFITENSLRIGSIWLVAFWALALADRINQLKAETEDANCELQKSKRQLNQILEGLPIGVVVYGLEQKLTYLNQRLMDIFNNPEKGFGRELVSGSALAEALKFFSLRVTGSDQEYPPERLPMWQAFTGMPASADDIEADLIDRRVPLEIWASPVKDEQGRVESVVAAVLDITQRKKDEAELTEYRQHLEQLVDDRTAQLTVINEVLQAEIAERQRLQEALQLRLEWLVAVNSANQTVNHKTDLPQIYQNFVGLIPQMLGAAEAFIAELDPDSPAIIIRAHSAQRDTQTVTNILQDWIETVIALPPAILSDPFFAQGKYAIFSRAQLSGLSGELSAFLQATESQFILLAPMQFQERMVGLLGLGYRDAEPCLSDSDTALLERICFDIAQIAEKAQIYEQSRVMVAIEERSRLARDLHDSVTQVLFAASLVAEVLPQIWRRDPEKAQASLEELRRLTRGALAEMRTMLLELRPSALVKTPLSDLLAQLTEAATSRTGVRFQLFIENLPSLPEEVHICFYRIAQESLNNVVKHAHASQVEVSLSVNPLASDLTEPQRAEVKLVVRDDGRGLVPEENGAPHMGLGIMSERAAAIHATLSMEGQPGAGTTVTLTWLTK
jgi:signal transduction histidine kinase/PAS domain-containing protein